MTHGHDGLRDNGGSDNGALTSKFIYSSISCEPVIREAEVLHTPALVGDLKIVGLWEAGKYTFLIIGL